MSKTLDRILPYLPAHLARAIIAAPEFDETARSERLPLVMLFADIDGFTPLTESLGRSGREGPEELTRLLNGFFTEMIGLLRRHGGEVIKFSGDALTVSFPVARDALGQAVGRARAAGLSMQAAMPKFCEMPSSAGPVTLGMRVGIGAGSGLLMQVGGLLGRYEYVVAGDAMRQAAAAEARSAVGEVILSPKATAIIDTEVEASATRRMSSPIQQGDLAKIEESLRRFVPGAVLGWLDDAVSDWVGVLRPMSTVFIGVSGLDYDAADAPDTLHRIVRRAQRLVYRHEGSINKVVVDDKGTVIVALFGAPPLAHKDDALRAVQTALALQQEPPAAHETYAIGISTGNVFAGTVGSDSRYEYTVMGDAVNLAARLMGRAKDGIILCDEDTRNGSRPSIKATGLDTLKIKGKSQRVRAFRVEDEDGPAASTVMRRRLAPLVGCEQTLESVQNALADVRSGQPRTLVIGGEPGIGKTRLLDEIQAMGNAASMTIWRSSSRGVAQQQANRIWSELFRDALGFPAADPGLRDRADAKLRALGLMDRVERGMVLQLIGMSRGTETFTELSDPEARARKLGLVLAQLVHRYAEDRPLLILLDDAQWLHPLSWRFATRLAGESGRPDSPVLLVIATRNADSPDAVEILQTGRAQCVSLTRFKREETADLVANQFHLPSDAVPPELVALLHERSEGVPYFVLELLGVLIDRGIVETWTQDSGRREVLYRGNLIKMADELPGSVRGLVLARIDRQPPERQLVLRVASVLGTTFSRDGLSHLIASVTELSAVNLDSALEELRDHGLLERDLGKSQEGTFAQNVVREVAYDTLLFSQRRELHSLAAEYFEAGVGGAIAPDTLLMELDPTSSPAAARAFDLAFHHREAEQEHRERPYRVLAARQAAAEFANDVALEHYARAIELTSDDAIEDRFQLLLERERVYGMVARHGRQRADLDSLDELADRIDTAAARAEVAIRRSRYDLARGRLDAALAASTVAVERALECGDELLQIRARLACGRAARRANDPSRALSELESARALLEATTAPAYRAYVLEELARLAERRGRYRSSLKLSTEALSIARRQALVRLESSLLEHLATAHARLGNLPEALECSRQNRELADRLGDRKSVARSLVAEGVVHNCRGDYAGALEVFERAFRLSQRNRDLPSLVASLGNLGLAHFQLGDYQRARICYEQALVDARELGLDYERFSVQLNLALLDIFEQRWGAAVERLQPLPEQFRKLELHVELGRALAYLGMAQCEAGQIDEARTALEQSLVVRTHLRHEGPYLEALVGMLRLCERNREKRKVSRYLEQTLTMMADLSLDGVMQPAPIFLAIYDVLARRRDARAKLVLTAAARELKTRAQRIGDRDARRRYVNDVPHNARIRELYREVVKGA